MPPRADPNQVEAAASPQKTLAYLRPESPTKRLQDEARQVSQHPLLPLFFLDSVRSADSFGAILARIGADLGGGIAILQVLDEAEQRNGDHRAQERHRRTRNHYRYDVLRTLPLGELEGQDTFRCAGLETTFRILYHCFLAIT